MITFDGSSKLAILSLGTTSLDVRDLYSRWKDWVAAGNAQYLPAFAVVGGEDIDVASGTKIPGYAFLTNGWRVRPQEANHTLAVVGGVLLVQGGGDPFVNTLGDYVVRVNYQQPVQAITVATGGGGSAPTASQVADAVWQRVLESSLTAEQIQRLMLAVLTGAGTFPPSPGAYVAKSVDGAKNRVAGAVDAAGTRTVTTRDGT